MVLDVGLLLPARRIFRRRAVVSMIPEGRFVANQQTNVPLHQVTQGPEARHLGHQAPVHVGLGVAGDHPIDMPVCGDPIGPLPEMFQDLANFHRRCLDSWIWGDGLLVTACL